METHDLIKYLVDIDYTKRPHNEPITEVITSDSHFVALGLAGMPLPFALITIGRIDQLFYLLDRGQLCEQHSSWNSKYNGTLLLWVGQQLRDVALAWYMCDNDVFASCCQISLYKQVARRLIDARFTINHPDVLDTICTIVPRTHLEIDTQLLDPLLKQITIPWNAPFTVFQRVVDSKCAYTLEKNCVYHLLVGRQLELMVNDPPFIRTLIATVPDILRELLPRATVAPTYITQLVTWGANPNHLDLVWKRDVARALLASPRFDYSKIYKDDNETCLHILCDFYDLQDLDTIVQTLANAGQLAALIDVIDHDEYTYLDRLVNRPPDGRPASKYVHFWNIIRTTLAVAATPDIHLQSIYRWCLGRRCGSVAELALCIHGIFTLYDAGGLSKKQLRAIIHNTAAPYRAILKAILAARIPWWHPTYIRTIVAPCHPYVIAPETQCFDCINFEHVQWDAIRSMPQYITFSATPSTVFCFEKADLVALWQNETTWRKLPDESYVMRILYYDFWVDQVAEVCFRCAQHYFIETDKQDRHVFTTLE